MSVVFLKSQDGDILTLDAVTNVSKSQQNSVTKSSLMSGLQGSDGYTIGNISVSFSGICTASKIERVSSAVSAPTPYKLNLLLSSMVNSQTRFTLYGNELIPTLKDVVITGYTLTQEKYTNAIEVNIALEQVFISSAAEVIWISRPTVEAEPEIPKSPTFGLNISAATVSTLKEQLRITSITSESTATTAAAIGVN